MSNSGEDVTTVILANSIAAVGIALCLLDFFVLQRRSFLELDILGIPIFTLGLVFVLYARATLGRHFTVRVKFVEDHRLIQSGLYKYIRHPIYLGLLVMDFSAPIAWRSAYGAVLLLPVVPLVLRRIHIEERAMALQFGAEYDSYRRRTRKFIPGLY